jgi:hypothetical protein
MRFWVDDHAARPTEPPACGFASQREVAAWYQEVAEQAELVLDRTEALLR